MGGPVQGESSRKQHHKATPLFAPLSTAASIYQLLASSPLPLYLFQFFLSVALRKNGGRKERERERGREALRKARKRQQTVERRGGEKGRHFQFNLLAEEVRRGGVRGE